MRCFDVFDGNVAGQCQEDPQRMAAFRNRVGIELAAVQIRQMVFDFCGQTWRGVVRGYSANRRGGRNCIGRRIGWSFQQRLNRSDEVFGVLRPIDRDIAEIDPADLDARGRPIVGASVLLSVLSTLQSFLMSAMPPSLRTASNTRKRATA